MRSFSTLALGLAAAAVASASDVEVLTKDTFSSFVKDNDLVLAEFYAPWCGHCKALAPEYEEAATTLKEKNIKLAKVDCTEEADLCQSHGVEGYPTLKVFRGEDNVSPYSGARKAPAIISYMTKQSLPAVSILTAETIEDFKTADKVVLVAYIDADDKKSNATFTTLAEKLRDSYLFGASNDAALAKAEGVTAPAVVLYKSFDEGKSIFGEKVLEAEAIEKFAKTASIPLIGEVGPETYAGYMETGLPLAYIFSETQEGRDTISAALKPIAEKHRGVVAFATIDAKAFGAHAGNLNLKADQWPAFAIQDTVNNKKYPYDQEKEITEKTIGQFLDDFVAGKVEPSIKSEEIPEKQEGVYVVVAKNYDEVVKDDAKDVLLEFYAPWCGHCKALAPKYDILADLYIKAGLTDKVTIAKVDATANDVPDEIQGFPTIKLFKAGDKANPITYSGSRDIEDLIKFVKENGKHGAEVTYVEEVAKDEEEDVSSLAKQAEAATESAKSGAEAATESVKSAASEATEAAKAAAEETHDEL